MTIIPTIKIVTAEFQAPYYMGRRVRLEITRLENGSFAVDRFLSGSVNPWNQIAHENGFSTLAEALAGASRTIIAFASGSIEISSLIVSLKLNKLDDIWKIFDQEDGLLLRSAPVFSDSIRIALDLAGDVR